MDKNEKLNVLLQRLNEVAHNQDHISREIHSLHIEILKLKNELEFSEKSDKPKEIETEKRTTLSAQFQNMEQDKKENRPTESSNQASKKSNFNFNELLGVKSDVEKFIGENIINKIGIVITVIGVAIGAKYSIDNNLISPLTRIILGYLFGLGLLGFGMYLKKKYENFSAVLVSGAMSIMYFITFAAFSFYSLFSQTTAFALMFFFTIFTVIAALNYNRQIIALIGMVGAYAIPFLLSDGSGKVLILFTYMTIINLGILYIAFYRYWKSLFYTAFVLSWMILGSWIMEKYDPLSQFSIGFTFLCLFFIIFYATILSYKLVKKEKFGKFDVLLLIANSLLFFGLGYYMVQLEEKGQQYMGIFTLANAIIHFAVSVVLYRQKLADKNLFYLVSGLVLVFLIIAIPVQLDGNGVTLLWTSLAAVLFWIGRTKAIAFYEKFSYPIMVLAFFSLVQDWVSEYAWNIDEHRVPIFNLDFLGSLAFVVGFGYINYLNIQKRYLQSVELKPRLHKFFAIVIPGIFVVSLYFAFELEIASYFDQLYTDSMVTINKNTDHAYAVSYYNTDYPRYGTIWILNYTMFFVSAMAFFIVRKFRNLKWAKLNIILICVALFSFLTFGLLACSELRESFLNSETDKYFKHGTQNIWIRYISFLFFGVALYALYKISEQDFVRKFFKIPFELIFHISILWIASSELINWMDIFHSQQSYKLGLSILWGVYSLLLIVLGIWKNNKPLRIGAMILFGITLLKLVVYDIAHLNTLSKTIVFVSLGILLLIISFLYNKFKNKIGTP